MNIALAVNGKHKEISVKKAAKIRDVMREEKVNGELVIIKLNGEITHPNARLREGDSLEFVHVIHSG